MHDQSGTCRYAFSGGDAGLPASGGRAGRRAEVLFVKLEEGGFEWSYSHSWAKQNRDQFEAFWRFQDGSDALWDWLSAHVAAEIGAHNLLKIWG